MQDPLSRWLQSLRLVPFVLIMLAASYTVVLPFAAATVIFPTIDPGTGPTSIRGAGFAGKVLLASVVAPVLETALFQWAPIRLLRLRGNVPWPVCLLASSSAFAAARTYSLGYVVFAFLVGFVFAYCYALCLPMRGSPFWVTSVVHALRNLLTTVVVSLSANAA